MASHSPLTSDTSNGAIDVDAARRYLYEREVLPSGLVPTQLLPSVQGNVVLRFGDVVFKQLGTGIERPDRTAVPHSVAAVMQRADDLAPEVVWTDDELGILVTRYVNDRNWGRLLAAGNIDFRTYEKAGLALATLHERLASASDHLIARPAPTGIDMSAAGADRDLAERLYVIGGRLVDPRAVFLHGNLVPDNVLLGTTGRMTFTGWRGEYVGDPTFDMATLLADGVAHTITEPHTFDSYVDAGRSFLAGYGRVDPSHLRELVGALLLGRRYSTDRRITDHGRALIFGDADLPWS